MEDGKYLSLSDNRDYKFLEDRIKKLESSYEKLTEESFEDIRKSIRLEQTLEGLSKATVELRAENKELREEIKNMNSMLRTTLTDTLNKMVELSDKQASASMNDVFKDKEFLKKLILYFAVALVTVVLSVLGIKSLIQL